MPAIYCFTCRGCGETWENSAVKLGIHPNNGCADVDIIRDYRAESVGIGPGVRESKLSKGVRDARTFHQWTERAADAEGI